MTVEEDYSEELEELTAEPVHPEPPEAGARGAGLRRPSPDIPPRRPGADHNMRYTGGRPARSSDTTRSRKNYLVNIDGVA